MHYAPQYHSRDEHLLPLPSAVARPRARLLPLLQNLRQSFCANAYRAAVAQRSRLPNLHRHRSRIDRSRLLLHDPCTHLLHHAHHNLTVPGIPLRPLAVARPSGVTLWASRARRGPHSPAKIDVSTIQILLVVVRANRNTLLAQTHLNNREQYRVRRFDRCHLSRQSNKELARSQSKC